MSEERGDAERMTRVERIRQRWSGRDWSERSIGPAINDIDYLLDENARLQRIIELQSQMLEMLGGRG